MNVKVSLEISFIREISPFFIKMEETADYSSCQDLCLSLGQRQMDLTPQGPKLVDRLSISPSNKLSKEEKKRKKDLQKMQHNIQERYHLGPVEKCQTILEVVDALIQRDGGEIASYKEKYE